MANIKNLEIVAKAGKVRAVIGYEPDELRWICMVNDYGPARETLTAGVHRTRADAIAWARDTIARKAWRDGSELPDWHDEQTARPN
jgi:hypothetical protein